MWWHGVDLVLAAAELQLAGGVRREPVTTHAEAVVVLERDLHVRGEGQDVDLLEELGWPAIRTNLHAVGQFQCPQCMCSPLLHGVWHAAGQCQRHP